MELGTSSTPRIDIVDFLQNKSRLAGTNLVLTSADLSSLRPNVPTWVFGDRDLIDDAYGCADISELHIFEFVRSDTGYWFTPKHAASLPLRYYSSAFLAHLSEVAITPPPTDFLFEHAGISKSRSALVRFIFRPSPQGGFFHSRYDDLVPDDSDDFSVFEMPMDVDSTYVDMVVEGERAALRNRLGQNKHVRKQGQRKSAVGVLLRVSSTHPDASTFCSNDTTSFTVGSVHHAGITLYLTNGLWPELHACLKTSKWRSSVCRESSHWATIGCDDCNDLQDLVRHLRTWRANSAIRQDVYCRRWEIEHAEDTPDELCLLSVQNGTLRASNDIVIVRTDGCESGNDGRINYDVLHQLLTTAQISAEISIIEGRDRRIEIRGEVNALVNCTKYVRIPPSRKPIKLIFARPADVAAPPQPRESMQPPDLQHSTSVGMPAPDDAPATAAEAPAAGKRLYHGTPFTPGNGSRSGEIVRVPLLSATQTSTPESDATHAAPHFSTTAVRLLDRFFSAEKGFYWTGIRVADEARISGIQISPHECSIGKYDYFKVEHDLAPAAKVHKGHRSRFFRRPAAADPTHVDVVEKVKQEALRWTKDIRAEAHRQHLVVVFDPTQFQPVNSGDTDNQAGANPAVTKRAKTSQSESTPSQATSDLQDSSMHDTGASIDPRSHGPTFPPGFYLAARPIYDLASAISASATDVMADQIAGGKIGEKESRDRALAQSTPATSSTPSKRSLPSRPSRPAPTA